MTKRLFFIGSMVFSSLVVASYEDPRLEVLCFFRDYDETARGFEFCRSYGLIDDIPTPLSIEYYGYGVTVMNIAILTEIIEHFGSCIKNYTPERGLRSFALSSNTSKRILSQMLSTIISQYIFLNNDRFSYLKTKGILWRFSALRMMQYSSSFALAKQVYRAMKEVLYQRFWYLHPQRSLMGKECLVCWEENTNNRLIVPCGDERHPICVTCYPHVVGDSQQYKCPLCARVTLEQKITDRELSVYDKIQQVSFPEKMRVCLLFLSECLILYSILLGISEYCFASNGDA